MPFCLGALLSAQLYGAYAPEGVRFATFALFSGMAMSITAFPVLARIISERGLSGTELGTTGLGCAAMADVTAWCLLALVLAIGRGSRRRRASRRRGSAALLGVAVLKGVASQGGRHLRIDTRAGRAACPAFARPAIHVRRGARHRVDRVHAIFGAFLAGMAVGGAAQLREPLRRAIEPLAGSVLVPLFFVYPGCERRLGSFAAATGSCAAPSSRPP